MRRVLASFKVSIGVGAACACLLACTSAARAQGGGAGGGFSGSIQGGGISGGSFTGTTTGSSGRNTFPGVTSGFRPLGSSFRTTGARGTSQFGQFGGGQLGQAGGQQFGGGFTGGVAGGGLQGRANQFNVIPPRISGAAVADSIKPAPPPFPEIQARLERLLTAATGASANRKIALELDGPVLVIGGLVENDYEKQLVESLARLEPGVDKVKNELTVLNPSPRRREPIPLDIF